MIRKHGEKYVKKYPVGEGKTTYFKVLRFCAIHGEIDLFVFPDFDSKHGNCPNTPREGAAAELPKAFRKAA